MKILPILAALLLVAGCKSPADQVKQLSVGMTRAEVIAQLGQPAGVTASGEREVLRYKLTRYRPPHRWPIKEEYLIHLRTNTVCAFGTPRDLKRTVIP